MLDLTRKVIISRRKSNLTAKLEPTVIPLSLIRIPLLV